MSRARILVTGVGGRSVGAGVLHALMRADPAVRERWETFAVDADPFSWGLYVADAHAVVPRAADPGYVERLAALVAEQRIAAVIPGTEAEVSVLTRRRAELAVPVIANVADLVPLMMDKRRTEATLRRLGLPVIPSRRWEERADAVREFGFPLLVKPTVGTGGSRGVHLVCSNRELDALAPLVAPESRSIVQPYLDADDSEYTVGVLSDQRSRVIDSIVLHRKLVGLSLLDQRQSGPCVASISTGISQGAIVRDRLIQGFCEQLAVSLGSRGPLNIQLRVHDDQCYVFEIHPRFSGTTPIRASAGFNEPDVLLRERLFGERFGRLHYRSELAAIRAYEHVLVPLEQLSATGVVSDHTAATAATAGEPA